MNPLMGDICFEQRWRNGLDYQAPTTFDADEYFVESINKQMGIDFCEEHHYSNSYSVTRAQFGMFRQEDHAICGVAGFSVPMHNAVVARYVADASVKGDGNAVELGRFVLLDEVGKNGESWFLGQSFRQIKDELPLIDTVLAMSDPIPRKTLAGQLVMPGHIGGIYQAFNGRYVGRSSKTTKILTDSGHVVNARSLSKVRNLEDGYKGMIRKMTNKFGCRPPEPNENLRLWSKEVTANYRRIKHPGNHVYVWAVGNNKEKRESRKKFVPELPRPKLDLKWYAETKIAERSIRRSSYGATS